MGMVELPDGWTLQAFRFALDPTDGQRQTIARQFGGRRYAYNWAVRTLKADIDRFHATGESGEAPSLCGLRQRFNQVKDSECVDRDTCEVWWSEISKEAFADGIGRRGRRLELAALPCRHHRGPQTRVPAVEEARP